MIILETERLVLKTITHNEIEQLFEHLFSDAEVMKYAFLGKSFTYADTTEFVENHFASEDSKIGLACLHEKKGDALVGVAGILKCDYFGRDDFEFGFILGKDHWDKGYATEIGQAQIDFCLHELELDRVLALTNQDNEKSQQVLEKLHMEFVKTVETDSRGVRKIYKKEA